MSSFYVFRASLVLSTSRVHLPLAPPFCNPNGGQDAELRCLSGHLKLGLPCPMWNSPIVQDSIPVPLPPRAWLGRTRGCLPGSASTSSWVTPAASAPWTWCVPYRAFPQPSGNPPSGLFSSVWPEPITKRGVLCGPVSIPCNAWATCSSCIFSIPRPSGVQFRMIRHWAEGYDEKYGGSSVPGAALIWWSIA